MNYSQKVARFFEICGYILLFSVLVVILCFALSVVYLLLFLPFLLLIFIPIFAAGFVLFIGCFEHSRGNLDEGKILHLWVWKIIFNLLPLIVTVYLIQPAKNPQIRQKTSEPDIFVYFCFLYWFLNISLAISAIWFDFEQEEKNKWLQKLLARK